MKTLRLTALTILTAATCSLALNPLEIDFHWNYKQRAALLLFENKDYPAAQKALEELAATAPTPRDKAKSLSLAAVALAHQGQYDAALQKAAALDQPMSDFTRVEVMAVSGKHAELLAAFKEADLAAWPADIGYKGLLRRAEAHAALKDDRAAVRDFERCAELAGADYAVSLDVLNRLGAMYETFQDEAAALEAYRKVVTVYENVERVRGPRNAYPNALLAMARLLVKQQKYDEALAHLAKYDPSASKTWGITVVETRGDICLAQGRKADARAHYQEAHKLAVQYEQNRHVQRLAKKIEDIK